MKACLVVLSLSLAQIVTIPHARADDVNGAARAFSQAQEAMLNNEPVRAADLYELADELAPSAPALRNATRARLAAGHLAMAATHAAELIRRYPNDKESRDVGNVVLARIGPQLARLEVACGASCTLLIDGKVIASVARDQHTVFSHPGARTVTAVFGDGRKTSSQVTATSTRPLTLRLEAPPRPVEARPALRSEPAGAANRPRTDRPAAQRSQGLSRWWVLGGSLVTAGLGAATVVSGLDTLSTRDKITKAVADRNQSQAQMLYDTGRDQQTRTNVLLGATITAGVGTAVLAWFTNWSGGHSERELAIVPSLTSVSLVYGSAF